MLDVQRIAIEFAGCGTRMGTQIGRRDRGLGDQITRASQSAALNLAEALGRRSARDKRNRIDIALGECREGMMAARIAEVCAFVNADDVRQYLALGDRTAAMLYRLGQSIGRD